MRGDIYEKDISAQQDQKKQKAWFQVSHEHPGGQAGIVQEKKKGET